MKDQEKAVERKGQGKVVERKDARKPRSVLAQSRMSLVEKYGRIAQGIVIETVIAITTESVESEVYGTSLNQLEALMDESHDFYIQISMSFKHQIYGFSVPFSLNTTSAD